MTRISPREMVQNHLASYRLPHVERGGRSKLEMLMDLTLTQWMMFLCTSLLFLQSHADGISSCFGMMMR